MRNPIDLLKGAFAILQSNPALFIGILLVPIVVSVIVSLFAPNEATGVIDATEWIVYAVLMLISAVVNILMSIALILAIDDRSLTVKAAYRQAMSFFWVYLGLTIAMSIILFVAFLLLIIPGIIVSVWFAFATFVLVLEHSGMKEALTRSREYVRGRWWGVFGRLVAVSLILVLFSLVISLLAVVIPSAAAAGALITALSMFLAPLGMAYVYLLYQDARGGASNPPPFESSPAEGL